MSNLQDYATRYEEIILSRRRLQQEFRQILREQRQRLDNEMTTPADSSSSSSSSTSSSMPPSFHRRHIAPMLISNHAAMRGMLQSAMLEAANVRRSNQQRRTIKVPPMLMKEQGGSPLVEEEQGGRLSNQVNPRRSNEEASEDWMESLQCLMEDTLYIQDFEQEQEAAAAAAAGEQEDCYKSNKGKKPQEAVASVEDSPFVFSLGQCLEVEALLSLSHMSSSCIRPLSVEEVEESCTVLSSNSTTGSGYDSQEQVEDFFHHYPEYGCQGATTTSDHDENGDDEYVVDNDDNDDDNDDDVNHGKEDTFYLFQTKIKKTNAASEGSAAVYLTLPLHPSSSHDDHVPNVSNQDDVASKRGKDNNRNYYNNNVSRHEPPPTNNYSHHYNNHHHLHNNNNNKQYSNSRGEASACPFRTAQELLPQNGMTNTAATTTTNPSSLPSTSGWPAPSPLYASEGGLVGVGVGGGVGTEQQEEEGCWTSTTSSMLPPSSSACSISGQINPPLHHRPQLSAGLKRKFQIPKPRSTTNHVSANSNSNAATATFHRNNSKGGSGGVLGGPRPSSTGNDTSGNDDNDLPEELRGLDKELIAKIENEIVDSGESVSFKDIAGLESAKQTVMELVCWPMKRPDLFTGLRRGPNGLLLFGPPGTGKTLIGKAIACESGATFFSISSSSLTSKWIGEGEKLVRTLFAVAAFREPSVVFIDEIDSLLTQRKADENEASRRIKTEFLVQLDGTGTSGQGRVLAIGATNRPHELDDAARRRFVKRLYIPLPEAGDREVLLRTLLEKNKHSLSDREILKLSNEATDGFSGADLKALCTDAALGPIRELGVRALDIDADDVPPISYKHFRHALKGMNPSVSQADLKAYVEFNNTYGSKSVSAKDYEGLSDDDDEEDHTSG